MIKNLPLKDFIFIRHGETDWNKEHRAMGSQDIPLNACGIEQAKEAAQFLSRESFVSIAVSPLARAKATAEIFAKEKRVSVTVIDELKECSWGTMEGQSKADDTWLDDWRQDLPIEGAELFSEFSTRVLRGFKKAMELPGPVLIVAHGGVYWPIQKALNLSIEDLKNCEPMYHKAPSSQDTPWSAYPLKKAI